MNPRRCVAVGIHLIKKENQLERPVPATRSTGASRLRRLLIKALYHIKPQRSELLLHIAVQMHAAYPAAQGRRNGVHQPLIVAMRIRGMAGRVMIDMTDFSCQKILQHRRWQLSRVAAVVQRFAVAGQPIAVGVNIQRMLNRHRFSANTGILRQLRQGQAVIALGGVRNGGFGAGDGESAVYDRL